MLAYFYNYTDDSNKLNKTLELKATATVTLKDDTEMVHPTIIVSRAIDNNYNYVYLSGFSRYYFVNNKTHSQQRAYVNLDVDVLMSFKGDLEDLEVIATRSSSNFNLYQVDSEVPKLAYNVIQTQRFKNGFGGQSFILATTSGGSAAPENLNESEVTE